MFVPSGSSLVCEPSVRWLVVALVALLATVAGCQSYHHQQQPPTAQTTLAPTNSSSNPYWRRPGCYRVGHTRTISIPGCVKFNLSTNACRGYCMSYSIPASEDLAGAQTVHDFQLADGAAATKASAAEPDRMLASDNLAIRRLFHNSAAGLRMQQQQQQPPSAQVGGGVFLQQDQQQSGERRDVVSVSQCCNMMETEDVVVNLRCGANEIRRLVFKSAKTCECFFCKHV